MNRATLLHILTVLATALFLAPAGAIPHELSISDNQTAVAGPHPEYGGTDGGLAEAIGLPRHSGSDLRKRQNCGATYYCPDFDVCCNSVGYSCCSKTVCCAPGYACLNGACYADVVYTIYSTSTRYITVTFRSTVYTTVGSTYWSTLTSLSITTHTIQGAVATSTVWVTVTQNARRLAPAQPRETGTAKITSTHSMSSSEGLPTPLATRMEMSGPARDSGKLKLRWALEHLGLLDKRTSTAYVTILVTSTFSTLNYATSTVFSVATGVTTITETSTSVVVQGAGSTTTVTSTTTTHLTDAPTGAGNGIGSGSGSGGGDNNNGQKGLSTSDKIALGVGLPGGLVAVGVMIGCGLVIVSADINNRSSIITAVAGAPTLCLQPVAVAMVWIRENTPGLWDKKTEF
ncbi:hypothetical protein B0H67DRAFT_647382 [Lasiosphaeris hirsuta]|uniref:Uncharacterized protein n=1 Tax=Lasiosphaeris hirsuta TaxID=260670 RepID=A0AA40AA47_9PEZI|nr:hypothetical protein B0H67DRAFT_647382 [Lasiosphaeris hirsuta]